MNNHHFILGFLLSWGLFSACTSDSGEACDMPPATLTQAAMTGYRGAVKHIEVYNRDDDFTELRADFDAQGRCLQWDVTGISAPETQQAQPLGAGSGWISAPGNYRYVYNAGGQLTAAVRSGFEGETEHYALTYGAHSCLLPLPFPVAGIPCFMVRGIERIESENFHFVCDGTKASAERHILSWMRLKEKTAYQLDNGRVTEQTTRLYRCTPQEGEEQIQRTRTFYTYQGEVLTRMLQVTVDSEDNQEKTESVFDVVHPCRLLCRRFYAGTDATPLCETVYRYDEAGRLIEVSDPSGDAFFEAPYTWQYGESDPYGNWTSSVRTYSEGTQAHLTQTVSYW